MRTRKKELVSDELKPFIGKLIRENRQKYNYSLEDLSDALNHKKNRQTLHKYETGLLNIPWKYKCMYTLLNFAFIAKFNQKTVYGSQTAMN